MVETEYIHNDPDNPGMRCDPDDYKWESTGVSVNFHLKKLRIHTPLLARFLIEDPVQHFLCSIVHR